MLALCLHDLPLVFAAIMLLALLAAERIVLQRRVVKMNARRLREMDRSGAVTYTTCFTETGMRIRNHSTGGQMEIAYGNFRYVVETADYTGNQLAVVFKRGMTDARRRTLKALLRQKCPRMKGLKGLFG